MSMPDSLKAYLAELCAQLPPGLGWGTRARILREVEDHILAAAEAARAAGQPEALSLQQALERSGPPTAIAAGFQLVVYLRRVQSTRVVLLGAFALSLGLVGLTFLRYPAIAASGAQVVFYLLVCAAILGGYAWVGLPTMQAATPEGALALRRGMMIGLLAGVVGTAVSLVTTLALVALWSSGASTATTLWIDHRIEEASLAFPILFWSAGTLISSVTVAMRTGRSHASLQLGLWSSIVYVIFTMITGLVSMHLLANSLAQSLWAHDVTCRTVRNIATCTIGDELGGITNALLIFPLLGIGIGWLGGKLGGRDVQAGISREPMQDNSLRHLRSIPLFMAGFCALFLMGVIGRWW